MTVERVKEILINYVDNDLESADPDYVKETLENICTEEELKELGFWNWFDFEEDEDE